MLNQFFDHETLVTVARILFGAGIFALAGWLASRRDRASMMELHTRIAAVSGEAQVTRARLYKLASVVDTLKPPPNKTPEHMAKMRAARKAKRNAE